MTTEEVYQHTKTLYETRIQEYRNKLFDAILNEEDDNILENLEAIFEYLKLNLNHLCCPSIDKRWGNTQARLELE